MSRYFVAAVLILRRGLEMKIVVVRSPKALRGLLRLIFGIKKDT